MPMLEFFPFLAIAVTSVLCGALLLALSRHVWNVRWTAARDTKSTFPLPKGSMGWPFIGETFHWLFQGSTFHKSRREKYGNVFKTHLLGKPVVRVTGAENIRKILLGEHSLVCTEWPQSTQIILGPNTLVNSTGELHRLKRKLLAKVFSHRALETYIPHLQDIIKSEIAKWCSEPGPVNVYAVARALTFRIAVRVLLGVNPEETQVTYLSKTFEQLISNLFSLPIDVSFSGLRKGIRARDALHTYMKRVIEVKHQSGQSERPKDMFDYILSSAKENNYNITLQELQETALELVFAAHSTTASACTSLILQLLRHPSVAEKVGQELKTQEWLGCARRPRSTDESCCDIKTPAEEETAEERTSVTVGAGPQTAHPHISAKTDGQASLCGAEQQGCIAKLPYMTLERLGQLRYLDCVIKEVLRFLPPVSGGYRTALRTFELDGYQVPKGWGIMYSIRDTHETEAVYQNPELFDPERFAAEREETKPGRFHYIPFGGGTRRCIGRQLAQVILKVLAVEIVSTTDLRLATDTFPEMQTVPILRPVNGLHAYFNYANLEKACVK